MTKNKRAKKLLNERFEDTKLKSGPDTLEKRFFHPLFTLVASAIILTAPPLIRYFSGSPLLTSPSSYGFINLFNARINPVCGITLSPNIALVISVLLGIFTALIAHQLVARWTTSPKRRLFTIALFLLSPWYAELFTSMIPLAFAVPLLFVALRFRSLRAPIAILTSFIAPTFSLLALLTLYLFTRKRSWLPGLLISLLLSFFTSSFVFRNPLLGFGVTGGLSLFIIVLALIELGHSFERRTALLYGALLVLSFWNSAALIIAGLISIPLGARALHWLLRRKWRLPHSKTLAFILLACSFLFLLLVNEGAIAQQEPLRATIETLKAAPPGAILAPAKYAPIIRTFTSAQPLLKENTCMEKPSLCRDVKRLYKSKRLPDAERILKEYNITSLFITKEMREGGIWRHDEDGILFLLKNSEAFQLITQKDGFELWQYSH